MTTAVLFGLSHFNKRAVHFNWRYVVLAMLAAVILAGAVVGVVATQRDNGPEIAVPGVSTSIPTTPPTAGPSIADRFVPPATVENGKVVLPVTQPDGSTFTSWRTSAT